MVSDAMGVKTLIVILMVLAVIAFGYGACNSKREAERYEKMGKPATMPADFYEEKAEWEGKPRPSQ
jgi:Tfp pilus assembly protein PilO